MSSPASISDHVPNYGTWLHGDERTSIDRHGKNVYGTPKVLPSTNLQSIMNDKKIADVFGLGGPQRAVVEQAIRDVCVHRNYLLHATNVRTNHVHSVVNARGKPEPVLNSFKANATRELRAAGLVAEDQPVWSRGGSTRYLWKPSHVEGAINYVLYGQGDDLPTF